MNWSFHLRDLGDLLLGDRPDVLAERVQARLAFFEVIEAAEVAIWQHLDALDGMFE